MEALSTVLSLLGVVLYIVVIIGIAAGVTWSVVKLFPPKTAARRPGAVVRDLALNRRERRTSSSGEYSRPWASATASYVTLP